MLFSRDNLKSFDTIMCLFDRFVNHVNCCFYVLFFFVCFIYLFIFLFFCFCFCLLFIMCRLAKKKTKKKQRQKRTNGQKSLGKIMKQ